MKHSLGGKNGWCGVCLKKPGNPESNCPQRAVNSDIENLDTPTIVKTDKHWGFCSDLCNETAASTVDILQETQLDVLSLKDCGIIGPRLEFNRTLEVCAGKKHDYPQMRVYEQKKKNGGKIYYKQLQSQTNYVNTHGPYPSLVDF